MKTALVLRDGPTGPLVIDEKTSIAEIRKAAPRLPETAIRALAAMPDFLRFCHENHERIHAQYIQGHLGGDPGFDWFSAER